MADSKQEPKIPDNARVMDVHPLDLKANPSMVFVVPVERDAKLVAIAPVVERGLISASGQPTGVMKPHLIFEARASAPRIPRRFVVVPAGAWIAQDDAHLVGSFFLYDSRQINPAVGLPVFVYEWPMNAEETAEFERLTNGDGPDVYAAIRKAQDAADGPLVLEGDDDPGPPGDPEPEHGGEGG